MHPPGFRLPAPGTGGPRITDHLIAFFPPGSRADAASPHRRAIRVPGAGRHRDGRDRGMSFRVQLQARGAECLRCKNSDAGPASPGVP